MDGLQWNDWNLLIDLPLNVLGTRRSTTCNLEVLIGPRNQEVLGRIHWVVGKEERSGGGGEAEQGTGQVVDFGNVIP